MRFSVLRRSITGFLEVGVWDRFIGFWVNAVGFSTALLLDLHQPRILQFPQGVHRFLPPSVEQVNHFTDRVIQENPSAVIRPPILADVYKRQPYDGAKEYYILDIEDDALLQNLIPLLEHLTPIPEKKKKP